MKIIIDKMTNEDWHDVVRIYLDGIHTRNATFQTRAPEWVEWDESHCSECRLVMKIDSKLIGWAALSRVSARKVYSGVAEVSIYLDPSFRGSGYGAMLLKSLVDLSEKEGYWTLQAGIFPENKASIAIHQKCGFRQVGVREKLGKMQNGDWRDVAFLERRSKITGL